MEISHFIMFVFFFTEERKVETVCCLIGYCVLVLASVGEV